MRCAGLGWAGAGSECSGERTTNFDNRAWTGDWNLVGHNGVGGLVCACTTHTPQTNSNKPPWSDQVRTSRAAGRMGVEEVEVRGERDKGRLGRSRQGSSSVLCSALLVLTLVSDRSRTIKSFLLMCLENAMTWSPSCVCAFGWGALRLLLMLVISCRRLSLSIACGTGACWSTGFWRRYGRQLGLRDAAAGAAWEFSVGKMNQRPCFVAHTVIGSS